MPPTQSTIQRLVGNKESGPPLEERVERILETQGRPPIQASNPSLPEAPEDPLPGPALLRGADVLSAHPLRVQVGPQGVAGTGPLYSATSAKWLPSPPALPSWLRETKEVRDQWQLPCIPHVGWVGLGKGSHQLEHSCPRSRRGRGSLGPS